MTEEDNIQTNDLSKSIHDDNLVSENNVLLEITETTENNVLLENTDIKDLVNVTEKLILSKVLEKALQNKELIDSIKLSEQNIDIINKILKNHPSILENVSNDISKIINNGSLDINDIPNMILLFNDIIELYTPISNLKLTKEEIVGFIKNVLIILVESDIIKLDNIDKKIIINLIIVSIKLLETQINLKKSCILCSFF
jgi:hypothetical protein